MSQTTAIAGASIEKGETVEIVTQRGRAVAYPVTTNYERSVLPVAAESASRGETITVRSSEGDETVSGTEALNMLPDEDEFDEEF